MKRTMAAAFVVVGMAALSLPATADPRNDVLSIAARCNAITDYRVWLDCYYGAAQPMRAILGLSPAPPSQVKLVPPAGTQPPAPVVPVAPPAGAVATARPAAPAGNEDYVPRQHVADYRFDKDNRFTVTMEDGSKWRQIQDDNLNAHWRAAPASYTASVSPSLLGYMMRVSDGHSYRVRRVQ
ncbi:MAG TPA: hypothetical protein VH189_10530 [Rhizomicrobium sp.]|nr:hypothetical protein [Rhizomicrobium sp.]